MKKQTIRKIFENRDAIIIAILALLVMGLIIVALPFLNSDEFKNFINNVYPFGPLIIIVYIALTQIFAPLPGSPGVVVSFAVFGWTQTRIFTYLGSLLSAIVSFYISRKLGRKWVRKLAGKKALKEIDEFAEAEGEKALMVSRLIGFSLFDYISYAAGLTNMEFKSYFLITVIFGGIANFTYMLIYKNLDFTTPKGFIIWYGSLLLLFPLFGFMIKKYLKRVKNKSSEKSK